MFPHWPQDLWCHNCVVPVNEDLAILFEFPHCIANVLDAVFVREHRAAVDYLVDPDRRYLSLFLAEVGVLPFRAVTRKSLSTVSVAVSHDFFPLS
jgi:hypothetical protein